VNTLKRIIMDGNDPVRNRDMMDI